MPDGRTEKATEKRRQDERKKGNIFQSQDVVTAFTLLFMTIFLRFLAPYMLEAFKRNMTLFFSEYAAVPQFSAGYLRRLSLEIVLQALVLIVPIALVAALSAFILTGVQTRFLFNVKRLKFSLNRLNPLAGIKKIITIRSTVELIKSLLKIAIIIGIAYSQIAKIIANAPKLIESDVVSSTVFVADSVYSIMIAIGGAMAAVGILDFFYQWWEYERSIMMSKQEIKEEYKQLEGDPEVRAAIRQRQRKISLSRMMQKLPMADVVITNPTHYAVAIMYDSEKNSAPVVIAKGQGYLAQKIKEVAAQHGIEIQENVELARALYSAVEIDQEIPPEFYQAVAEVLAYVYKIKRSRVSV